MVKKPWTVNETEDGYVVARNGKDGTPDVYDVFFYTKEEAQEQADDLNERVAFHEAW